jgi:hypothetical protein
MSSPPGTTSPARPRRALFVATLIAAMAALTAPAGAGVVLNTIDREATLDDAGRVVETTGPIRCSARERASIRVTISQRTTGAVAEGRWRGGCRLTTTTWTARRFAPHGSATFQPGMAKACALGITRRDSEVTDAKQWCRTVRLVRDANA